MSQSINGIGSTQPLNPANPQQPSAAQAGDSTFSALLAETMEQPVAGQSAAGSGTTDSSASSGATNALGMDGSLLSALMMSSMGGIGDSSDAGMESGGLSSIMMFILMLMLMGNGESFGGVSSSDLPSFPELSIENVEEEGSAASKAFAAFQGEYGPIVESALSRLGDPYSQPKAGEGDYTDCSYLSRWCYRQLGIEIPRTAAAQGKYCVENDLTLEKDELQPGDLIFYSLKKNGRFMDISHVGIYAGNGMMVDASSNAGEVVYRPVFGEPILYGRPAPTEA